MADLFQPSRDDRRRLENRVGTPGNGYDMSYVDRFNPVTPSGVTRLGARRGTPHYTRPARSPEDETRAKGLLRQALPIGWDGPVIDQFPGERIEAVYLVRPSNIRHAERLSEREIEELELGDLIRAKVCEATTNISHNIGDHAVTPTVYGMMICKFRYFVLLEKHPKHGVFAPITSHEEKGLKGLSRLERQTHFGFRKEGEPFDRSRLTEGDPEYLSLNDPLELRNGVLDPESFADLSYPTSLYWSSNISWKGCLNDTSTQRVLEAYESMRTSTTEPANETGPPESFIENEATPGTDSRPILEPSEQIDNLWGVGGHELSTPNTNGENDPDPPKGTAEEQKAAFVRRQSDITTALRPQKQIEEILVREIESATLVAAEAENKARKAKLDYKINLSTGDAGEYALELLKEAAEQAAHDCARKQMLKKSMVALFEDVLSNPDLRPRVAVGEEVNQERMTIINNAAHSLKCRLESIWEQM